MTRRESALKNAVDREKRSKKAVISAVTGMYQDELKKGGKGKFKNSFSVNKISAFTHISRQTCSKHLKAWEKERVTP